MSKSSVDPPASFLKESLQRNADAQPMTVYCILCPKWSATGTAGETRIASINHRTENHPELLNPRRIVRHKRVFSQKMTAEREAEIEEDRRQRMRALGIA